MIGIVAAMDAEIHEFEKRMDVVDHTKTIAGCTLTYGKWKGKEPEIHFFGEYPCGA